jgi:TolB-like protein/tetratricopeptide (TPR) repeat protein
LVRCRKPCDWSQSLPSIVERLKSTKLIQWALTYLAGAGVVWQLIGELGERWGLTDATLRSVDVLLVVGLGVVLVLAWFHGEKGQQRISKAEILILSSLLVIAGSGLVLVRGASMEDSTPTLGSGTSGEVNPLSIAVLPFDNDDPEQEHLANGLAEELLHVLAQVEGLTVTSWTSSRPLAEQGLPADSIGRLLGVAHILSGTVRHSGQRLRITPRLVEVETDRIVWSELFNETVRDVFEIEDRITLAVASQLEIRLSGRSAVASRSTIDEDAHELFLKGREAYYVGDEVGLRASIDYYRQALELDPNYALAWSAIAEAYVFLADAYLPPGEAYGNARVAALRALELQEIPEARAALGFSGVALNWDWEGIATEGERAIATNPNLGIAYLYRVWPLLLAGRRDEALRSVDRALTLDPELPFVKWVRTNTLLLARDYAGAVESSQVLLDMDPPFFYVESWGAAAHRGLGDFDQAMAIYDHIGRAHGEQPLPGLAITHARMGDEDAARAMALDLEEEWERRYVVPVMVAGVYAALGDRDGMLRWLERSFEMGDPWVIMALGLEEFDPYRSDPAFLDLLERVGLGAYPWARNPAR